MNEKQLSSYFLTCPVCFHDFYKIYNQIYFRPFNELSLNSTATVSIDSAIGSPLWSAGATSALLDSDANERGDSPMSYKRRRLSNGPCTYSEAEKKTEIIGEKNDKEDITHKSNLMNPQYVNVEDAQATSAEKGKIFTKDLCNLLSFLIISHSFISFEMGLARQTEWKMNY